MPLKRTAACLLLACAVATSAHAVPGETINGVAIMPGVERLSYISTKYYGIRPAYDTCVAATHGRVPDQGDCADEEYTFQDERLNKAYKALMTKLAADKETEAAARKAQRAWLEFRDDDCAARAQRFGSDAGPATLSICKMETTAQRAQQLEDWRSSLGGH